MTSAASPSCPSDSLAAILRGEDVSWSSLGVRPAEFLAACAKHDLTPLIHERLGRRFNDWPEDLRADLARNAHAEAAREILHGKEIVSVLDALATEGIRPILFKGTPLAYTVYSTPSWRPRSDTDLLIRREEVDAIRRVMAGLGYGAPVQCDGELLFCQFELHKDDAFGIRHAFDFHWKISTQSMFADVLTYDELAGGTVPVPALGAHARAAGLLHALLLACIHPVMHHRNAERLIWVYDTHVLASRLTAIEADDFVALAIRKRVAAICARALTIARSRFRTHLPDQLVATLTGPHLPEPSATYLRPERRWHDEVVSSIRGLPRWTDRLRLLREVMFPSPRYILSAYGLGGGVLAPMLLPVLYLHRGVRGACKVLVGRK